MLLLLRMGNLYTAHCVGKAHWSNTETKAYTDGEFAAKQGSGQVVRLQDYG